MRRRVGPLPDAGIAANRRAAARAVGLTGRRHLEEEAMRSSVTFAVACGAIALTAFAAEAAQGRQRLGRLLLHERPRGPVGLQLHDPCPVSGQRVRHRRRVLREAAAGGGAAAGRIRAAGGAGAGPARGENWSRQLRSRGNAIAKAGRLSRWRISDLHHKMCEKIESDGGRKGSGVRRAHLRARKIGAGAACPIIVL